MKLLHIGCGRMKHSGFINTDKDTLDISKPWNFENESIDGIVSMQVLQQLYWRDLVFALREAYRVLKNGGVMRFGTLLIDSGRPLDFLLGWNNINLFSFELLKKVLLQVGFRYVRLCEFGQTLIPEFAKVDNRKDRGSSYIEVVK